MGLAFKSTFPGRDVCPKKGVVLERGRAGSDASRRGRDVLGLLPFNLVIVRRYSLQPVIGAFLE